MIPSVEKVKQKIQQQRNEDKVDRKVMGSKVEALKAGISAYRKNSKEQINHLHELGKWLYKLENFEEALSVSISILRWNSAKFAPKHAVPTGPVRWSARKSNRRHRYLDSGASGPHKLILCKISQARPVVLTQTAHEPHLCQTGSSNPA